MVRYQGGGVPSNEFLPTHSAHRVPSIPSGVEGGIGVSALEPLVPSIAPVVSCVPPLPSVPPLRLAQTLWRQVVGWNACTPHVSRPVLAYIAPLPC